MRARRTDANHRAVTEAIRALGYPVKSLHTQGGGVEDLLVGVTWTEPMPPTRGMRVHHAWVLVEIKSVERESTGYYQHTPAQKAWYRATGGLPAARRDFGTGCGGPTSADVRMNVNKTTVASSSVRELTALLNAGLELTPEVRGAIAGLVAAAARADRREREEQGMAR